jgi:hypothetical protein
MPIFRSRRVFLDARPKRRKSPEFDPDAIESKKILTPSPRSRQDERIRANAPRSYCAAYAKELSNGTEF